MIIIGNVLGIIKEFIKENKTLLIGALIAALATIIAAIITAIWSKSDTIIFINNPTTSPTDNIVQYPRTELWIIIPISLFIQIIIWILIRLKNPELKK